MHIHPQREWTHPAKH